MRPTHLQSESPGKQEHVLAADRPSSQFHRIPSYFHDPPNLLDNCFTTEGLRFLRNSKAEDFDAFDCSSAVSFGLLIVFPFVPRDAERYRDESLNDSITTFSVLSREFNAEIARIGTERPSVSRRNSSRQCRIQINSLACTFTVSPLASCIFRIASAVLLGPSGTFDMYHPRTKCCTGGRDPAFLKWKIYRRDPGKH
jgi:hypothetical protein